MSGQSYLSSNGKCQKMESRQVYYFILSQNLFNFYKLEHAVQEIAHLNCP